MLWKVRRSSAGHVGKRSGFLLAEVLVAMVVAGLFVGVLSRAFATAWSATHAPMEILSAVTVARAVAAEPDDPADGGSGQMGGFSFSQSSGSVVLVTRQPRLAPAPVVPSPSAPAARLAPAGGSRSAATGNPAAPPLELRRRSITVRAPSGRIVTLDSIRLDAAAN